MSARTLLRIAFLVTVAFAAPAATAQEDGRVLGGMRLDRSTVANGLTSMAYVRLRAGGASVGRGVEVDSSYGRAHAVCVVGKDGPWESVRLEQVLRESKSLGGVTLWPEAGVGDSPLFGGLVFADGRLFGWPGSGPVLTASPEGSFRLLDAPEFAPGIVEGDAGTSVTLASVNGPSAPGAVGLVCGPFRGRSREALAWPAGTLVIPLVPGSANNHPDWAVWDERLERTQRVWRPGRPEPLEKASVATGDWALLAPPDLPADQREALLDSREVVVRAPLPPEFDFCLFAVEAPGGRWVARGGGLAGGEINELHPTTLLGVDRGGGRLTIAGFGGTGRGQFAPTGEELAGLLERLGVEDAIAFPSRGDNVLANIEDADALAASRQSFARVALAAVTGAPELRLDPAETGFERLAVRSVQGVMARGGGNGPLAAIDGRIGPEDAVANYWSEPLPPGMRLPTGPTDPARGQTLQSFDLALVRPAEVAVVELFHAESCGFSPQFNLRAWRLMGRPSADKEWEVLASSRLDEPVARERIVLDRPTLVGDMRFEVLEPNFLPGGGTARLAEIVLWGREPRER